MTLLDRFIPASDEMVNAVFDMVELNPDMKHVELGSGDGRFVFEAEKRGLESVGYEIDSELAEHSRIEHGITVITDDCFNADVSQADIITCWFTKLPETEYLMEKLRSEMKVGSVLIKGGRNDYNWEPESIIQSGRNTICLYRKEL